MTARYVMRRIGGVAVPVFALCLHLVLALGDEEVNALGPALDKIPTGDHAGAVSLALEVARRDPGNLMAWYLCGMVRVHNLSDFAGAIECLDEVVKLVTEEGREFSEMRHVYRGRGMSWFLLEDFAKAEADLRAGIDLEPDGVHGHLLWFLAAERAGLDGAERLERYAETHVSGDWPHPLVALYLGSASPEAVLEAAKVEDQRQTAGNLCEAHFYIAQLQRLRGEEKLAASHFERCLETGMERYNEFLMAREELKKSAGP